MRLFVSTALLLAATIPAAAQPGTITYDFGTAAGTFAVTSSTATNISGGTATAANLSANTPAFQTFNANPNVLAGQSGYAAYLTANGNATLNAGTGTYYSFQLTPTAANTAVSLTSVNFTISGYTRNSAGTTGYSILTSANNFGAAFGSGTYNANGPFTNQAATGNVAVAIGAPLDVRLYVYGSNGTGDYTTALDNISFGVTPVPEPTTLMAASAALLGLGGLIRRRMIGV